MVVSKIAKACEIEPPTVTNLLSRIEEAHLIERKQLNGNRRSWYVFLTTEGESVNKKVFKIFDEVRKKLLKVLQ